MKNSPHKTVFITGASSGIGEATAQRCLNAGYHVIGLARDFNKSNLRHKHYHTIECDLNNIAALETQVKHIIKQYQPHYFLHSAGFGRFGSIEQFSASQIQQMIQVNLTSAILISRLLVPHLRKLGSGKMVFIGSESAITTGKKGALYCASKFGLRGFALALRDDVANDNIAVSIINPGMVKSPFFDTLNFRPDNAPNNAILCTDIAQIVCFIYDSHPNFILDEINCSPAIKSIDFSKKAE